MFADLLDDLHADGRWQPGIDGDADALVIGGKHNLDRRRSVAQTLIRQQIARLYAKGLRELGQG